jgi:hypothetical protein
MLAKVEILNIMKIFHKIECIRMLYIDLLQVNSINLN